MPTVSAGAEAVAARAATVGFLVNENTNLPSDALYTPEIVPFNFETTYANDAPERGAILMQQKLGTTSVAFDIGITGTAAERRAKLSTLASWLNVTEPKNLVRPDTPTWFYKAVPDGQITTERGING